VTLKSKEQAAEGQPSHHRADRVAPVLPPAAGAWLALLWPVAEITPATFGSLKQLQPPPEMWLARDQEADPLRVYLPGPGRGERVQEKKIVIKSNKFQTKDMW